MTTAIDSDPRVKQDAAPLDRLALAVLAIAALGLAAALAWASAHRGPWYDELYTWYVTRPGRGFLAGLRESWLPDNHPPLFYALVWTTRQIGGSIETLRLINLGIMLAALAGGWALLRKQPQHWPTAAAFLLVLVAHEAATDNGAELRSYFLSFAAAAVVVQALVAAWLDGELADRAQRWALGVALLVGFNTHSLTTVLIGALLVPFLALALLRGNRALVRTILIPALAAGTVFLATCVVQMPLWLSNTATFWIEGGLDSARWSIQYAVQRAAEANPVILLGAVAGALALLASGWKARRMPPRLEVMVLLGAGIVLGCTLITALHLLRPVILERYLAALIPAMAMGLALAFAEAARLVSPRIAAGGLVLALLAGLWGAQANAWHTGAYGGWEGSAALAARVQRVCPDSPIHIDPASWNANVMALPPADNKAVFGASHALLADRFGFSVEPAGSRRISARCPTLFWAEHDTSGQWDERGIAARLRSQGFAIERVWQYRLDGGWIAADRPLQGL